MPTWKWLKTRIWSWRKDSPLVFLLVCLLVVLAASFLVILFFETPKWAYYIFSIGDKFQILQFLGIALGTIIIGLLAIPFVKTRIFSWWKDSPPVFLLVSLLVVLAASFLFISFFEAPNLQKDLKGAFYLFGIENKYQILKSLGIAMGGVLLAIQAVTAHRRAKAMERTAEEQAKTNENAEKGLRQERLKNAIEHMGDDSGSVRLGGAYELFHLAEDNQELRRTVFDVLCAHVRRTTSGSEYQKECSKKPSEEIQSLLTLLFTQEHDVFAGLRIHLAGSWLNGAHLSNARLQGASLWNTQLQGAVLVDAQLQGAILMDSCKRRIFGMRSCMGRIFGMRSCMGRLSEGRSCKGRFSGVRSCKGRVSCGRSCRGRPVKQYIFPMGLRDA